MRRFVIVILLLLAAGLVWFVQRRSPGSAGPLAPSETESAAQAQPTPAQDPLRPESAAAAREPQGQPAPDLLAADAVSPGSAGDLDLRGSIVAIDENGTEHRSADGQFELVACTGSHGASQDVTVQAGAWTARFPRAALLGFGGVRLDGRDAVPEGELSGKPIRLPVPEDGVVELRVRWLRGLRLFVRDRESKVDLAAVTLVRAEGWPRMDYPHPGDVTPERLLASAQPSPIPIAPQTGRHLALHAGSPGHAWERLTIDTAEGGDQYLLLGPGGDLDLELRAERIDPSTVVRVRDPQGLVAAEVDVRDRRRLSLEGLPTGRLRVGAEIGPWWENPIVLAKGNVEVRAGERAQLVLELGAAPKDTSVVLAGEVVIPAAWEARSFLLVVTLLDPPLGRRETILRLPSNSMRPDGERAGVWHWRCDGLQAGRYQLLLHTFQYSIALRVPETGLEDARIEVPEPCDARVRVVDKDSGVDAQVDAVLWNCRRPEWVNGGGSQRAAWDEGTRRWKLRAPRGEVELHTQGGDFRQVRTLVDLRPGASEFVLEVERQYSVLFKLAQAGTPVLWPKVVEVKWRPKEGGKEQSLWGGGGSALLVIFEHPGVWILTLPEIPGYRAVPPFEVRVDPEHRSEHTVDLVPSG